ncbi:MAG TPA: tetratricopeptide repeat protein [Gemmatimonadales bacterium]|jgi:tetratricopeptide (TPR) repeat protein|nr:tetratricopeptide repeat protein [Gemmatimonadales bacterium]
MKSYTTRDVAKLLGLSEAQVRSQARVGYLAPDRGPHNAYRFSFQDLVLLRTAKSLNEARIPPRRIRRALRALLHELPEGRSLSGVRISSEGDKIVVRDGRDTWNPESGQLLLDFHVADLAAEVGPVARRLARRARRSDEPLTATEWYDLGADLETVAPEDARDAYARAVVLDPRHASARVNLGRLLQDLGLAVEAVQQYRAALAIQPRHPTAAFNLGTALEDLGRRREAIEAYRQALDADRDFADAHFNLARLYDQTGKRAAALRHLKAYKLLSE